MVLAMMDAASAMHTRPPLTSASFGRRTRNVAHFFGTRHGPHYGGGPGAQGVVKAAAPEYPLVVSVRQVHGAETLVIDRPLRVGERFPDGRDAIITDQAGLLLTIRTADCVPVLLADDARGLVGAVHAGWRGAVRGVVAAAIRGMAERFGADPALLHLVMGPSVGPCCYEVDAPVIEQLPTDLPEAGAALVPTGSRTGRLDLKALIRAQALSLGLAGDRIHRVDLCTMCREDVFYSYRREGAVHGTMVNGIMLTHG